MKATQDQKISAIRFINESKNFLVCTNDGFFVYETSTAEPKVKANIPGGTALCDAYRNSNIFFVVGTGKHVDYPTTKLLLWNASTNLVTGEVQFSPSMQIVDIQTRGDWILVMFKDSYKLFHFDKGFSQDQVVAEFQTQINGVKSGQVTIHQALDESTITIAFADADKKGKV